MVTLACTKYCIMAAKVVALILLHSQYMHSECYRSRFDYELPLEEGG